VLIEQLFSIGPVEAFDVGVLIRLARLDVLDGHAGTFSPVREGLTEELRAVVGSQHLRQPMFSLQSLKDPDQAHRRDRGVDLDVQRLAIKVIDNVEGPEAAAIQ